MNLGASLLNVTAPLTVSGATILSSTVAITGTTQCNSTLTVVGNSNLYNTYIRSGNNLYINDTANLYPSTFSVDATGILNIGATSTIKMNSNTSFITGMTLPTAQVFTVVGNLTCNALTITPIQLGYLSTLTSNVQTQLTAKGSLGSANAWSSTNSFSGVTTLTGNLTCNALTITPIQLGYLSTLTSNVQTQLTTQTTAITTATTALTNVSYNSGNTTTTFSDNVVVTGTSTVNGLFTANGSDGSCKVILSGGTATYASLSILPGSVIYNSGTTSGINGILNISSAAQDGVKLTIRNLTTGSANANLVVNFTGTSYIINSYNTSQSIWTLTNTVGFCSLNLISYAGSWYTTDGH